MPKPLGHGFKICYFVDANHAGESLTRRSQTGFIVMFNNAPNYWHSKKQTSVETSTFGSEMMAMKQAADYIRGFRYKLSIFGIPVEEPSYMYSDNRSVLVGSTRTDSTLKKKLQSIAFHFIREGCAADEWRTTYINTSENISSLEEADLYRDKHLWK